MIHFDTNALVALPLWARDGHPAIRRVLGGEAAAACAVVWYEFLNGPLAKDEAALARAFLQGRIVPITEDDATLAATLFNGAGRRRTLKTDALIAALAIRANAEFVTLNTADFEPFVAQGLRLLPMA
ncbi:MAG: PIN domain-containing protein [Burkholderiaceae bacterium]